MNIVLFEDAAVAKLYPITVGRPAYAVSCASYTLVDLLTPCSTAIRGAVRPHLIELQKFDRPALHQTTLDNSKPTLLLNAVVAPTAANRQTLVNWAASGSPGAVYSGDRLIAALLPAKAPLPGREANAYELRDYLGGPTIAKLPPAPHKISWFEYPHDVVQANLDTFTDNLELRLSEGAYQEQQDGVFLAGSANIGDHVVWDASLGPIIVEPGATIGPYCYVRGPVYIGRGARILEHAAIKDSVSLAHTTKIGGEVEGTVIEPYSNKQHHGFLGHSYLGSWVNLGAGTSNSDLKNTYGTVKMEYRGEKVATGMQFLGAIVGDYAKTAINTGIFTGKTVGVCSMLYGFVTTNVASFVNYARLFGQVTELPPDVMIATQERMFLRRKVTQRPCDIQLIHDMYLLTQDERQLAGEPLAL